MNTWWDKKQQSCSWGHVGDKWPNKCFCLLMSLPLFLLFTLTALSSEKPWLKVLLLSCFPRWKWTKAIMTMSRACYEVLNKNKSYGNWIEWMTSGVIKQTALHIQWQGHKIVTFWHLERATKEAFRKMSSTWQLWMAFESSSSGRQSIPLWTEMGFIQLYT